MVGPAFDTAVGQRCYPPPTHPTLAARFWGHVGLRLVQDAAKLIRSAITVLTKFYGQKAKAQAAADASAKDKSGFKANGKGNGVIGIRWVRLGRRRRIDPKARRSRPEIESNPNRPPTWPRSDPTHTSTPLRSQVDIESTADRPRVPTAHRPQVPTPD